MADKGIFDSGLGKIEYTMLQKIILELFDRPFWDFWMKMMIEMEILFGPHLYMPLKYKT